jgi:hypothetical protein
MGKDTDMNGCRNKRLAVGGTAAAALAFFAVALFAQSSTRPAKTDVTAEAKARLATAERVCLMLHEEVGGAPKAHGGVEHTYLWSKRRMEAQLAVDAARGDDVSAVQRHADWMRQLATRIDELHKAGVTSQFEVASTEFYVAEADELLARARAK